MTRTSTTALAALVGIGVVVAPAPASAREPTDPGITATSYSHVVADFGSRPRDGVGIAAFFDAFRFTEDGQPRATAGAHVDLDVDGTGYVCELDGPAELTVAEDLDSATLTTTLDGECAQVPTGGAHPFSLRAEVTLTGAGPVQTRRQVIRPDSGGICLQRFRERPAAGNGAATVVAPTIGLEERVTITPAPSHGMQHVQEWCLTRGPG
jgi:hypothetical protein